MSSLAVKLFGAFSIQIDGQDIDAFATAKARGLLAYLAVEGTRPLDRGHLAGFLWPDVLDESARGNLRYALSNVRKAIGDQAANPPYLLTTRRTIQLNPDALDAGALLVDVNQFQMLFQQAQSDLTAAKEAIALYRAPFLESTLVTDSPEFDAWAQLQRDLLHRQMAELISRVVVYLADTGLYPEAIPYAQMGVDHEPWREEAHVQLMNVQWRSGQADAAMRQYEQCRQRLQDELNVAPAPETVALYEAIRDDRGAFGRVGVADTPAFNPSLEDEEKSDYEDEDASGTQRNIPAQAKSFIGRESELSEIAERFAKPHCRQVTIIGPGGMGKTQLALEFARRSIDSFADGVWFASLAGVADHEQIPATVIDTLGILMSPEQEPLVRLGQYLRDKSLLLILDNYEHLREGVLLVAKLLEQAPRLSILVTSRERLNLQVETTFPLGGLDLPKTDLQQTHAQNGHLGAQESTQYSGAVALFVDCAQRADASFTLTDDVRPAVNAICHLIDGMPLGIELAAVWTRLLPCHEILENLQRSIDLLTVSMPDVPVRHRSMRALIEESWQNLSPETQQIFARASIFRGGCDWPALQEVAEANMLHVAELVDRGFLRRMSDGSYQIHELMRQYGAEKLAEIPSEDAGHSAATVAARHAHHYLDFLQQKEAELISMKQAEAALSIADRIENVRAAWLWALNAQQVDLLDGALESLFKYYRNRGLAYEGAALFEQTAEQIAADAQAPVALLVRVRNHLGTFLEPLGRTDECLELLTQNLAQARQHKLMHGTAWALVNLGAVIAWREVERAKEMFEEGQQLFQQLEDAEGVIAALGNLWYFVLVRQVDKQPALAAAEEALMWSRDLDAPLLIAYNLARVGGTYTGLCQYEQAETYAREALQLAQQLQNKPLQADMFNNLAVIARNQSDLECSRLLQEESLKIHQQIGMESGSALAAQENLGRIASRMGDWQAALHLLQETATISRRANNEFMRGRCHEGLAYVWTQLGDYQQARKELRSAIAVKDLWHIVGVRIAILETLILILIAEDAHETAAVLFAYKMHHYPPFRDSVVDSDEIETTLRTTLGDVRYQQIAQEAPQRDLDELVESVLS